MTKSSQNKPLAIINNLNVSFRNGDLKNQVLFDVNLELLENEILAVVGESGSGKSVTSKALMGLLPVKNAIIDATELSILDNDLQIFNGKDWSRFRGSVISMIFQEPMSLLTLPSHAVIKLPKYWKLIPNYLIKKLKQKYYDFLKR